MVFCCVCVLRFVVIVFGIYLDGLLVLVFSFWCFIVWFVWLLIMLGCACLAAVLDVLVSVFVCDCLDAILFNSIGCLAAVLLVYLDGLFIAVGLSAFVCRFD